jgi:hypothetical protein
LHQDLQKEEINNDKPDWAILKSGSPVLDDPRARVYNFGPGIYALLCGEILESGGWINSVASPLEVR